MTCICGLVTKDGTIYVGADSAGVSGLSLNVRKDPKVFVKHGMIFGFCGSFRMGQIIHYSFLPPVNENNLDDDTYMRTTFIDALRKTFETNGCLKKKDGVDSGNFFLVGYKGRLYNVQDDFQVGESIHPWDACGCGEDIALGALYALNDLKLPPKKKVELALRAAEEYSAGVRGPYTVLSVKK